MSIQSEIERIRIGTQDIKAAIRRKNVSIPDGAKIDTLHSYISQIGGGGGNGSGDGKKVTTGYTTSTIINTGLSKVEQFIIYTETLTGHGLMSAICANKGGNYLNAIACTCTYFSQYESSDCYISEISVAANLIGGEVEWTTTIDSSSFISGARYYWIAIGSI